MDDMRYISCNLCGLGNASQITSQNNYRVVKCENCGLVYVNPMPSQETLNGLYNDYHQRDGKDEFTWAKLMEGNFKEVSALLNRMFPEKGRLLDIGCGYGHFIERMSSFGWSSEGIDPSSRTVRYAKEKRLNVIETSIASVDFSANSFDAVTAFYVLEHLPDPFLALKKIFAMLKPGGVAILRVPHTTPIIRFLSFFGIKNELYDLPFHLYDFSPGTLRLLMKKAGFSSIKIIPGMPTLPRNYIEKVISVASVSIARLLFYGSGGRILLPGISKTVIAIKQVQG